MHIVIMAVHFNHYASSLLNLADWGPARSQPVGLIHHHPINYARAQIFWTIGLLITEQLVDSLNGWDHDYSTLVSKTCGSLGCPPPGRCTQMERWSTLRERSHPRFPFCHHLCRAFWTLAWSHISWMYSGHTIECWLQGGPSTTALMAPFRPSEPVRPSLCSHAGQSPICWIQKVDAWFFVHQH